MAGAKQVKQTKKVSTGLSWKQLFIALSVATNIGFVVVIITMMTTNALDSMFMHQGLSRYCAGFNDSKFSEAGDKVRALRDYTCATGEAKTYFDKGFKEYLDYKGVK